jgi:hypothetical protein
VSHDHRAAIRVRRAHFNVGLYVSKSAAQQSELRPGVADCGCATRSVRLRQLLRQCGWPRLIVAAWQQTRNTQSYMRMVKVASDRGRLA